MTKYSRLGFIRIVRSALAAVVMLAPGAVAAHETQHLINQWSEVCTSGRVAQYRYVHLGVSTYTLSAADVQGMCLNGDNFDAAGQPCADGECSMRAEWTNASPRSLYCAVYHGHNLTGGEWYYSQGVGYDANGTCVTPQYFVADAPPQEDLGPSTPCCGNPIDPATGNKYQPESDYRAAGSSSLAFDRWYNSMSRESGASGANWKHSYDRKLVLDYGIQPTYVQGAAANSQKFTTKQAACEQGWAVIRSRHLGLATTTALYQNNVCNIYQGATLKGTKPVYGTPFNPPMNPTLVAIHARRANGKSIRFAAGASFTPKPDVTEKLESVAGGYKFTDKDTVELYDTAGKLLSITDSNGYQRAMGYDGQGRLQAVTDSFGRSLSFSYDTANRISNFTDADGRIYTYGYDGAGNLASVLYPDSKTRLYHYEDSRFPNALTGITDENNVRFATWAYDAEGRAIQSKHADDADITALTYNADGTTTAVGALGASRVYSFSLINGVNKSTAITQPCVGCGTSTSSTTYDANGFVNLKTDFNGNQTDFDYNALGLETQRIEAVGTAQQRSITTQWHATFRLPTQIDEPGRRTVYVYDATTGDRPSQTVTDLNTLESRSTTWTYTTAGRVLTVDGPRTDVSDVTTYTYYNCSTGGQCGQVETITNALGHVTEITSYDNHGNPLTIVDPNGVTTTLTYDLRQRLKTRTVAGALTTFDYDGVGQLDKVTMPDGSHLDYTYDNAQRLTGIQDNAGNSIHYTLDLAGNRTAEEVLDPAAVLKRKLSQVFNVLGRLSEIRNAAGQTVASYAYDEQGNRTSETAHEAATSFETVNEFDALNRLWRSTAPDDGVTQYAHNARDQLIGVTDPKALTTTYVLNALGDVQELASPDTGTTGYGYDSAGNRTSQTDARGVPVAYSYDALNRLTFVDYPGTAEDVTYSYDSAAQPYGKGRLTGVTDAAGATVLIYDARGNVTQEQRTIDGSTYTTGYGYDAADRVTNITYPSGRVVTYVRNPLGHITTVTTTVSGNTVTLAQDITYLPFGGVQAYTLGNGVAVTRAYDADYRLQGVTDVGVSTVQNLDFTYDRRGNVTLRDDLVVSVTEGLAYDEMSRVTSANGAYGAQGFTYDDVGNRLTQTGTAPETYNYEGTSHHLSSLASGASFTYDDAGNVTARGALALTYNASHRVATATLGGVTVTNTYGASGQRVKKVAAGVTTVFQYNQHGRLLAEHPDSGSMREYIWLDNIPLAHSSGAGLAYFHVDQLNTPQKMTDASQAIVWQASYQPFGAANVTASSGYDNPLRFPGQYFDAETGLHQNWHRDYDPSIGRYLQSDPIGLEGGLNTYLYGNANPLRYVDPDGLDAFACAFGDGLNCRPGDLADSPPPPPPPPPIAPCVAKCVAKNQVTGALRDYVLLRSGLVIAEHGPPKYTVPASLTWGAAVKKLGFYYTMGDLGHDIGSCLAECEQASLCEMQ